MPNHCFNQLEIYWWDEEDSPNARKIYEAISTRNDEEELYIDFNNIIPMPDILRNTGSGARTLKDEHGNDYAVRTWINDADGTARLPTPAETQELHRIGYNNWYDWSCEHWGTKWNAYNQKLTDLDDERLIITFDTAWGPPEPVIEALKEKFPHAHITGHYVGEGNEFAGVF